MCLTNETVRGKTVSPASGEAFGVRQPAAAFLSQPAGAVSFGVPRQSDFRVCVAWRLVLRGVRPTHRQQAGWGKRQQAAAVQGLRRVSEQ